MQAVTLDLLIMLLSPLMCALTIGTVHPSFQPQHNLDLVCVGQRRLGLLCVPYYGVLCVFALQLIGLGLSIVAQFDATHRCASVVCGT